MPTTSSPRASKRSATADPMNPAAPVTSTFIRSEPFPRKRLSEAPVRTLSRQQVLHVEQHRLSLAELSDRRSAHRLELLVRDCDHDRVIAAFFEVRNRLDAVLVLRLVDVDPRVVDV